MPKPVNSTGRYIPGLDGLRALAVLAVIVYHLGWQGLPGGLLGVGIFFTLSGYLITDLMINERRLSGQIHMQRFWLRRARRLLPSMFIMVGAVSLWLLLSDPSRLASIGGDIASSLLYVSNWRLIFHHVSYFESFGPPSPIGHLWSLAVEEQFYLIWPLIVVLVLRFMPKRGMLAVSAMILAAASALAMAFIYEPGMDPSRVYYGTDTRAFGMLLGAALAIIWPSWKLNNAVSLSPKARGFLDGVGAAGLIAIVVMILCTGEYDPFLYRGGMVLLSLATAAVIAAAVHPASRIGSLLGTNPLRWLGVRSYGIYLWHYPVIILSTPAVDTGDGHMLRSLLQLAATIVIAALSWTFIEEPIRHGALGKLWKQLRMSPAAAGRAYKKPAFAAILCLCVFIIAATVSLNKWLLDDVRAASTEGSSSVHIEDRQTASANNDDEHFLPVIEDTAASKPTATPKPTPDPTQAPKPDANGHQGGKDSSKTDTSTPTASATPATGNNGQEQEASKPSGTPMTDIGAPPQEGSGPTENTGPPDSTGQPPVPTSEPVKQPEGKAGEGIIAIGDSIMLDIQQDLEELLPGIQVDGQVGRQFKEAQEIIDRLREEGKLGSTVIIGLGTNGSFPQKQLNKLLDSLSTVDQVLFINTRVPRDWQDTVNDMLKQTASKYDNVTVVDWYAASKGKNEYFAKDGVHLRANGAKAYASLVANAL